MSPPRNAVFAPNQSDARQLARAFGLDPTEWSSFSFHTALMGRQFDRIVIRLPDNPSEFDLRRIVEIRTKLSEHGVFEQIGPARSDFQPPVEQRHWKDEDDEPDAD